MTHNVGMGRDERTEQQRKNDAAQTGRPGSKTNDIFVTTGPATGLSDARAKDVADPDAKFDE